MRLVSVDGSWGEELRDLHREERLRGWVERVSVERNYWHQRAANEELRDLLAGQWEEWGFEVSLQGRYGNVVALPPGASGSIVLLCAHYDSVATTRGADDNGSALAVMMEVSRVAAQKGHPTGVGFVSFNCEEDGLLGSRDFVESFVAGWDIEVEVAHVLEMVGYCSHQPGSQKNPLPQMLKTPDVGDFIGLLGNHPSLEALDRALEVAKAMAGAPKILALKAYFGSERFFADLHRSDHQPFWEAGIPALMWTDTAEFRNPHYHKMSDVPDTLDYAFMAQLTGLLVEILGLN